MPRNGKPRRSETEKAYQHEEIAWRFLRGESQASIGKALGISQQQVSVDLKWLREEWQRQAVETTTFIWAETLARIDNLERYYWEGFHRSLQDQVVMGVEQTEGLPSSEQGTGKQ